MAFQQGLSGLNAASHNLEVIGNNVANANTTGFKASRAEFADVYAATLGGATTNQSGIGVSISDVAQMFQQGNMTVTNNPLDLAVNGSGFFRMNTQGSVTYTRSGQFRVDKDGYFANAQGDRLTGYPANQAGLILQSSSAQDLRVSTNDISPRTTTQAEIASNFDSRLLPLPAAAFNFGDPTTYHNTTTVQVFDSLGNPHNLSIYMLKTAPNTWQIYGQNDAVPINAGAPIGTMNFTSAGTIDPATTTLPFVLSAAMTTGAATPQAIALDFTGTTQFGSSFGVTRVAQDGYTSGRLLGYAISGDGVIQGRYSNGQSLAQGQIVLASFMNPQGLHPIGNTSWAETSESGQPAVGAPSQGNRGVINAGSLEESNVDLTAELVNMITAQRTYQANAQTIKTQDQLMQTLVNLR
ncbi:MAG: flagellar hook protein FlgE [Burkholderiales bacterium]